MRSSISPQSAKKLGHRRVAAACPWRRPASCRAPRPSSADGIPLEGTSEDGRSNAREARVASLDEPSQRRKHRVQRRPHRRQPNGDGQSGRDLRDRHGPRHARQDRRIGHAPGGAGRTTPGVTRRHVRDGHGPGAPGRRPHGKVQVPQHRDQDRARLAPRVERRRLRPGPIRSRLRLGDHGRQSGRDRDHQLLRMDQHPGQGAPAFPDRAPGHAGEVGGESCRVGVRYVPAAEIDRRPDHKGGAPAVWHARHGREGPASRDLHRRLHRDS